MLHQLSDLAQHLSLAYERVTLPCSSMNCGDVIYRRYAIQHSHSCSFQLLNMCIRLLSTLLPVSTLRLANQGCGACTQAPLLFKSQWHQVHSCACSTLDPALRMEQKLFPDWRGLVLLGAGLTYLLLTPGACGL